MLLEDNSMVKFLDKIKYWLTTVVAIVGALVSLFAYIQLDLQPFKESTQITVAAKANQVFVRWNVLTDIEEDGRLTYYVDNKPIYHSHFHEVDRKTWIDIVELPIGTKKQFNFTAIWEFKGLKTGFQVEHIIFNTKVKVK